MSDLTAFTYDFRDDLKLTPNRRDQLNEEEDDLERNLDDIDIDNSPDKGKVTNSQI